MLNNIIENENKVYQNTNNLFIANNLPGNKKKKTRLLVQKGIENILLRMDDIVLFYTENKIVYVIDRFEKKYLIYCHLSEIEDDLDSSIFFRANRQYIISINFIKSFRAYEKVKIKVDMNAEPSHWIIISQETAPSFRKWIYEA